MTTPAADEYANIAHRMRVIKGDPDPPCGRCSGAGWEYSGCGSTSFPHVYAPCSACNNPYDFPKPLSA